MLIHEETSFNLIIRDMWTDLGAVNTRTLVRKTQPIQVHTTKLRHDRRSHRATQNNVHLSDQQGVGFLLASAPPSPVRHFKSGFH